MCPAFTISRRARSLPTVLSPCDYQRHLFPQLPAAKIAGFGQLKPCYQRYELACFQPRTVNPEP